VRGLGEENIYFKKNEGISPDLRKEYDGYLLFLHRIQEVFNFAASGCLLKALFAAFNNYKVILVDLKKDKIFIGKYIFEKSFEAL